MQGDVREDSQPGLHYVVQPMEGARFMNQDQINFVCQLIKEFVDFTDLSEEEFVKLEEILDKEIL